MQFDLFNFLTVLGVKLFRVCVSTLLQDLLQLFVNLGFTFLAVLQQSRVMKEYFKTFGFIHCIYVNCHFQILI